LAKLEGAARPPEDAVVDMRAIFNHLRADAATLSRGRHRIAFSCDETLRVIGSSTEIFSAFGNLVINAVRYTPEGGQ
ncbi:two-component system sensor histidine kinase PhoR, partial [Escherichia coli]|nr:two-component system sensor histidine kinase PhoR [Escherichia coli]